MKNLFLLTMFLSLLTLISCSEKELIEEANKIPEGWTLQEEVIVIDGERYEVEVIGNPETDELEILNAPTILTDFLLKYDETLVSHLLLGGEKPIIYYYKNIEEFNNKVKFENKTPTNNKSYQGGYSRSWEHGYYNGSHYEHLGFGKSLTQNLTWLKNYYHNDTFAYGYTHNYVGSDINDRISVVEIGQYDNSQPITYYAEKHSNFNGTGKLVISKVWTSHSTVYAPLWLISRGCCGKSWNDVISSCETWQSDLSISGQTEF